MATSSQVESKSPRGKFHLSVLASVVLGSFFLVSGTGKLLNVNALIVGVETYGVPYFLAPLSVFLPTVEMLLGLLLWFPATRKTASLVAILLLIVLSAVYGYGHLFRSIDECGCMGEFSVLDTTPLQTFLRNTLLFALALIVWRTDEASEKMLSPWQRIAILTLGLVAATASGASSIEPLYQSKHKLLGKNIHDTPLSNFITTSPSVSYLLFFYSVNCPNCWDAIENAKAYKQQGVVDSVVGFTFASDSSLKKYEALVKPSFTTHVLQGKQVLLVTSSVPTVFHIRRDTVYYVEQNHLMSPLSFRERVLLRKPIWF